MVSLTVPLVCTTTPSIPIIGIRLVGIKRLVLARALSILREEKNKIGLISTTVRTCKCCVGTIYIHLGGSMCQPSTHAIN